MSLLKDFLQGKWLGHPLHPALVHVPTGLFPAALVFDLISLSGDGNVVATRCAFWSIAIGLVVALAAAPTGVADWWEIKRGKPAYTVGLFHAAMNVIVIVLMAISLWLRWRHGISAAQAPGHAIALSIIGNVVLFVSGYIGGRMVFNHGIGVARMSKKKWRNIAREGHARLPVE